MDGCVLLTCGLCILCALGFQWYTMQHCPVSLDRRQATEGLAVVMMRFLNAQTEFAPWWVDFGSLLAVLRHSRIMVWDPDVDFSLVEPSAAMTSGDNARHAGARLLAQKLREYIAQELPGGAHWVTYSPPRGLIQVHHHMAHGDIWLWRRAADSRSLVSNDYTTQVQTRQLDLVVPVRCDKRWLGVERVCVPRASDDLMRQEFGADFMTPIVSHFECFENVWNGRLATIAYVAMAAISLPLLYGCLYLYRRKSAAAGNIAPLYVPVDCPSGRQE
jgi:hypothetical protein